MKTIITIFIVLGFFITVHNNSDQTLNCFVNWVDHPFKFSGPVNVHGGEYDAGEKMTLFMEYVPKHYWVRWTIPRGDIKNAYVFETNTKSKKVLLTPTGATVK